MKMITKNGETNRACTLLGAIKTMKEAVKWVEERTEKLREGESIEIKIKIANLDDYYQYIESWEVRAWEVKESE